MLWFLCLCSGTNAQNLFTGIWYSTWYALHGPYYWIRGHGVGSSTQVLADVDGDGLDDAGVIFDSPGTWYFALSTGNGFAPYTQWATEIHGVSLTGDVTGNGKADAVVFDPATGTWAVSESQGTHFGPQESWLAGHGVGSKKQMLADVNGDNKADAVVFFDLGSPGFDGAWYVALSNGTHFGTPSMWIDGHGHGANGVFLGDVNGDKKADAVVVFAAGTWYVALAQSGSFGGYTEWATSFGGGAQRWMLGDTSGSGKMDAIAYYDNDNARAAWEVAASTGTGFGPTVVWKGSHGHTCEHGKCYFGGIPSSWQAVGKVMRHAASLVDPVAFFPNDGTWAVLPDGYPAPNMYNTWEGWDLRYIPQAPPGSIPAYQTYDSGDSKVIDSHLQMISDAKIDFLLFDQTNGIDVNGGYIKARAVATCERVALFNAQKLRIFHSTAIGALQYSHNPQDVEAEAMAVWNSFVNSSECGGPQNYFHDQASGKPLLVVMSEYPDRIKFLNWGGDKTYSNKFTLKWCQGVLPGAAGSPPASDFGFYFGWGITQGSLPPGNYDATIVMPGWNNSAGQFVARNQGRYYNDSCWARALSLNTHYVVINSFNEFAEETGVQPADTRFLQRGDDQWYNISGVLDPTMYWRATVWFNAQRKRANASNFSLI